MLNLFLNMLQFIGKLISTLFLRTTFSPSVFFLYVILYSYSTYSVDYIKLDQSKTCLFTENARSHNQNTEKSFFCIASNENIWMGAFSMNECVIWEEELRAESPPTFSSACMISPFTVCVSALLYHSQLRQQSHCMDCRRVTFCAQTIYIKSEEKTYCLEVV